MPQISLTSFESNVLADVIEKRRDTLDCIVRMLRRQRTETADDASLMAAKLQEGIVLQHVAAKLRKARTKANRLLRGKIAKRNVTACDRGGVTL